MTIRVLVLGSGGHARVLIDLLEGPGNEIAMILDADRTCWGREVLGYRIEGGDDLVLGHGINQVQLVNAVGSIDRQTLARRRALFERFKTLGYSFAEVRHPSATISRYALLGEGVQIMAGAVVQASAKIGANSIVNTLASVDHDCAIGAHVHVAPGVTLSGNVQIEDEVHIGTGAVVRQGVHIGKQALIGAGALVIDHVPAGATVLGQRVAGKQ